MYAIAYRVNISVNLLNILLFLSNTYQRFTRFIILLSRSEILKIDRSDRSTIEQHNNGSSVCRARANELAPLTYYERSIDLFTGDGAGG